MRLKVFENIIPSQALKPLKDLNGLSLKTSEFRPEYKNLNGNRMTS
jgi:hypothetical protein